MLGQRGQSAQRRKARERRCVEEDTMEPAADPVFGFESEDCTDRLAVPELGEKISIINVHAERFAYGLPPPRFHFCIDRVAVRRLSGRRRARHAHRGALRRR
ncbi:hypothetical protein SRHO_G00025800 [Serrasalmus rhombeus]